MDVIASGRGQGTRTVLQDIKVLTVGQALKAEGGTLRAGSVTLEVDPRQTEVLTEATLAGSVRLALRHQLDRAFREPLDDKGPGSDSTSPVNQGDNDNLASTAAESGAADEPDPDQLIAATTPKPMKPIISIKGVNQSLTGSQWAVEPEGPPAAPAIETTP